MSIQFLKGECIEMRSTERRATRTESDSSSHGEDRTTVVESILIKPHGAKFLAALIGLLAMLACGGFLYVLAEKQAALNEIETMSQTHMVERQLVSFISVNRLILHQFQLAIRASEDISNTKFRNIAEPLSQKHPYIKRMSLAYQGETSFIYPLGLNQSLLGKSVDATLLASFRDSVEFLVLQREDSTEQRSSLVFHQLLRPELQDAVNQGLLFMELDVYHYLKSEIFRDKLQLQPFRIKNIDSDQVLFEVGNPHLFTSGKSHDLNVQLADSMWQIQTLRIEAPLDQLIWNWVVALVFSLFLALGSYRVICVYRQRSVDVRAGAYRANFDLLTGLPNRYHFSRRLREMIEESQRNQSDFAIFFMDIDHFKHVNDQLGQGAGDAILSEFSARLEASAKSSDLVARISGDEFVFVAHEVDDVIKADLLAEKIKKHLQQPIEYAGQQHFLTLSMGVAMYPIDGADAPTLLHHSDQAMYAAKRAGRNRHFFFNEGMREQAESYLLIHQDLLRGLEAGEFELYYQPVLNVKTENVDFCEALIRWNHPENGLVMPDKFIPVAERTGAIREIGNWAFGQACRDIRSFDEGDINVKIAINHSMSEYYSSRAFERWKRILSENYVSGDRFIFEIPEALLMDKKSVRMSVVTAMRKMGVQFAIDDFGTGHSAINYLRNYPAEILKIDSSLIQGMRTNSKDRTLVEVVLTLAKSLGKVVVAEGVEDEEVANQLKELDCDYLQGNWLLEPKPINRLIPYLHQHMFELEDRASNL
ncbi:MAG: bifunctional diguanylate cyclase/phosphodiesterase [Oceanospirillaceae bacterium]|nr:bifunctional diguanylate cyclase/phosphodiesterase [Oceanospirillaceae bacterium]